MQDYRLHRTPPRRVVRDRYRPSAPATSCSRRRCPKRRLAAPGPRAARPLPASAAARRGDAFRDGPMAARRAGGERHQFLSALSPPETPRAVRGRGPAAGRARDGALAPRRQLSAALGAPLLLPLPPRGSALAALAVPRPSPPAGCAVCRSEADLLA